MADPDDYIARSLAFAAKAAQRTDAEIWDDYQRLALLYASLARARASWRGYSDWILDKDEQRQRD